MYGYVFACAEVGLDFQVSDKFMLYPGYEPPAPEPWPLVMHYGITYNVMHFAFDKHWRAQRRAAVGPRFRFLPPQSCPQRLSQVWGKNDVLCVCPRMSIRAGTCPRT